MTLGAAPHILVASDSFKGTLSSRDVARIVSEEISRAFPEAHIRSLSVGDGGEGTLDALVETLEGRFLSVPTHDSLGNPIEARIALVEDAEGVPVAIVEAASSNGLTLIPAELRDSEATGSYGVGELISAALDAGAETVLIGIGGSATNDGGMGCLRALGVRFADAEGVELEGIGADLARVSSVDLSGLDPRISDVSLRAMCDVDNPLTGPRGATFVFAPQKGADVSRLAEIDAAMAAYAERVEAALGRSFSETPGAGAAGGLGFALAGVCAAELTSGVEAVLELLGFDALLEEADLCITGEGRFDAQTADGKLISGIASHCERAGVPCIAICGAVEEGSKEAALPGLDAVFATVSEPQPTGITPESAERALRATAARVLEQLAEGRNVCDVR